MPTPLKNQNTRPKRSKHMLAYKFTASLVFFFTIYAVAIIPVFSLSPTDKNWDNLERGGIAALDSNQYGIAEPLLRKALAQAKEFRPTDMRLAKSFAELGRLYTIRGQFAKAALYFEAELTVKEQLLRNKLYECIPTMASLIQFYLSYDLLHKSLPLTQKLLALVDTVRETHQKPAIEWAIGCDAVGDRFYSMRNFDLASRLFTAALGIKKVLLPANHLSLANSYERLGNLSLKRSDPATAEKYFCQASQITNKVLPQSDEAHARSDKLEKCRSLLKLAQNQNYEKKDPVASEHKERPSIPFIVITQKGVGNL